MYIQIAERIIPALSDLVRWVTVLALCIVQWALFYVGIFQS